MPVYHSKLFRESDLAHRYLDGLNGLEIGGSAHNAFGLDTHNVDFTSSMDTSFKQEEVALCGEAMPVDIVAFGAKIPVPDRSYDFVIASHVIEHFFDPIAALEEWRRIARKYIYIICPQRDALPEDRPLSLTSLSELVARHAGRINVPSVDDHRHYTRWTSETFVQMCELFRFCVVAVQDPDDKVGNGFAVVIDTAPSLLDSLSTARRWLRSWIGYRASLFLARQNYPRQEGP